MSDIRTPGTMVVPKFYPFPYAMLGEDIDTARWNKSKGWIGMVLGKTGRHEHEIMLLTSSEIGSSFVIIVFIDELVAIM